MVQLWRICAVFFYFSFTSKVESDEAAFKGVQIMQITLTLAGF
jgi:hypothetical protein